MYIYPIYSTVFCVNLGFQEFLSEIINITLVFEEYEVFLKAALMLYLIHKSYIWSSSCFLPLLSFVSSFVI